MRFAHVNIVSSDWRALAEFYQSVFNFKIVPPLRQQSGDWLEKGTGLKNASLEGAHLLLPGYGEKGPTLEIYQYGTVEEQAPVLPNKRGFGHIAFEVESVEEITEAVLRNGGKSFGEITRRTVEGVGELTFVYLRDPEGNLIEVQSWK